MTSKRFSLESLQRMQSPEQFFGLMRWMCEHDSKHRFSVNQMAHISHPNLSYHQFAIPKKSGGIRVISSPNQELMYLQRIVKDILLENFTPSDQAYGFVEGRNVAQNATRHLGHRYVYNLDLKNFFPSISEARVIGALTTDPYSLQQPVAQWIGKICCYYDKALHKRVLPQGAPTSPLLSNIVCRWLDNRLEGLARAYKLTYTRYADDITFSGNHHLFSPQGDFCQTLKDIIESEHFSINEKKVRLQTKGQRQEVTGITLAEGRLNVKKTLVKEIRRMLRTWETQGYIVAQAEFRKSRDAFLTPYDKQVGPNIRIEDVLSGKLEYLKMVKGHDDPTYKKLALRLNNLLSSDIKPDDRHRKLK